MDFVQAACRIATAHPDAVLTFMTDQRPVVTAARSKSPALVPAGHLYCGPATLMPATVAKRGLEWIAAQPKEAWRHPENDDPRWRRFFVDQGITVFTTIPSLVEHPDILPTTIRHRCAERVTAAWYAGNEFRASDLQWSLMSR